MRYPVETPARVAYDAASRTFWQAHEQRRDDALLACRLPGHGRWPLLLRFVYLIHFDFSLANFAFDV
jgi:hypothetical protein